MTAEKINAPLKGGNHTKPHSDFPSLYRKTLWPFTSQFRPQVKIVIGHPKDR